MIFDEKGPLFKKRAFFMRMRRGKVRSELVQGDHQGHSYYWEYRKNAEYYGVFNPSTQKFEREIVGARFICREDDIQTAVYSHENSIYDYDGNLIKSLDLSESEYIYDIVFDGAGTQIIVCIATDLTEDALREVIISCTE